MNNHHRSPLGNSSLVLVRSGTFEQKQWVELEDFPGLDLPRNHLWRQMQVRFLQTGDFLAIRESDLKSITTERGPKDQILTVTHTEPQSVIVYTENTTHTQVETVERWVQTHSYLPNKWLLKLMSVLGPPQSPSLTE